ncbi:LacI family DNA-binding transcriptional regulator [Photobacterium sp. DNB23_23_1]|uniref:LacI family transcriptional regulator n=1 Tax=Photobacterium pectinilyticum TaxID=2906793 RepID=A0ABT1N9F8_9GAMM|nr:LacI family DNA-binding transcriptional regulator [Photobacterium sp. ZSDE20]MCQ1060479.1 LacI family transcriptional regulator [Photobacterium sp. ZSDE20]MDD1827879.1 LacI family transcriptional regulator [Photobacterium sp. ZSDE20]
MATINDISKMVGVSKATVSRAINGTGQVSKETKKAIFEAMDALNFRPNSLAQALATNKSNSIGIVLSDFDGNYFGRLLKQASQTAEKTGKQLIVTDGHNCAKREKEAIHFLADRKCDVIILYTRKMSVSDIISLKRSISTPIVNVGRDLPASAGYTVGFDHTHAAQIAITHLIDLGHKDIIYIGPEPTTPTTRLRFQAFEEKLEQHQLVAQDRHIICPDFTVYGGYDACQQLLKVKVPFSAIFAASDDIAIGVMKALSDAGIKVPEDVSVVGIDNQEKSAFVTPSLTTVELPIKAMTLHAMQIAQELAEGKQVTNGSKLFTGELIVRHSATPPNT